MFKYVIIIIILINFGGCKSKEEPQEALGSPVFGISGTIDQKLVNIQAGVNNYFMNTSYETDQYGVLQFVGNLAKNDCIGCGESLKITIRNYTVKTPFTIDSADIAGNYIYYNNGNTIDRHYELACTANALGIGNAAISWDFGNGKFSTETNPIVKFTAAGIYPITCNAIFPNNCFSTLSQPVFLTPTRVGKSINFNTNTVDSQTILFNSIPVNANAFVTWEFGDGQTASGTIVTHKYASAGLYKVCMEYILGPDTLQFCKNVNTQYYTLCKSNYSFSSRYIEDSMQFSKVIIEWKGADGKLYSSANVEQTPESIFTLSNSNNYILNEKGQTTRKYQFLLSCKVENGGKVINLSNVSGWFGYAHP